MSPTLMTPEDRRLLPTIVGNNPTDTPVPGQTELRQAIDRANTARGGVVDRRKPWNVRRSALRTRTKEPAASP